MFETDMLEQLQERFRKAKLLKDAVQVVIDAKQSGFTDWAESAYLTLKAENAQDPVEWKTVLIETCK